MPASIVIPQKTNSDMTLNLVRQIHQYEPESEVIVIHDTQDDEMKELPNCRLIRNRGKGVTAAWNHGIEEAANEHVILLNNDVICSGEFVDQLTAGGHFGGAVIGAAWRTERMLGGHVELIGGAGRRWLEGWCLAFHKTCWLHVGQFDESMVMYFSDLDFQHKAELCGYQLLSTEGVPLHHLGHQTTHNTPGIWSQWQKDRATFKRKLEAMAR